MASLIMVPTLNFSVGRSGKSFRKTNSVTGRVDVIKAMRIEKPLEELYNVRVERNVPAERLVNLGVSKWSVWKTGKCKLPWDWQVDQLVYIEEGEVRVVPEGSEKYMQFVAGDLVRYPKWFEADLWFNGPYQERYCFRAYGDD
ncbi:hypothetical protein HS088_TW22G00140 [Tripterygium wilfordii]|uniref:(S)-ureidoglycine aminohydrolase cupin domain-containing protein n=1 Tax=Tripterygium wilfordii TaxID=458696 RepID=A0A7J7BX62_TRIWF|nr:uncharacterized protein LOC119990498 [Tripterygium wilfordii]XP_038692373.1 uncharacterized protein LOC119990498 [Tripterygium wilfordii]XP_038692374.1 uncharacterized protein LOC119990498 [Tripterygium wilfordii]KAF5726462.1 hypothetical protein HS088_TW22G00140 [Tripterygium wilfordii]